MTFSDFAKILFPYCADGQTQSDFVLLLVDMIMEEPQAEYDKKNSEEDNYNPLSTLKPDTLGKIYSGKHTISKGNASIIKGHLDKERFAQYINDKPIDAQMEIADTMSRSAPSFDVKETGQSCAELFSQILDDLFIPNSRTPSVRMHYTERTPANNCGSKKPALQNADGIKDKFFASHIPAREFVDREAPRKAFYDAINGQTPFHQNVMMYYGIGGIGKSSLIKKLKEHSKSQDILYSSVDFDDPTLRTPYKALSCLERNFQAVFPHFDIAVTLCFIKRNPDFLPSDIGLPNEISRVALSAMQKGKRWRPHTVSGLTNLIYSECGTEFDLEPSIQDTLSDLEDYDATAIEEELPNFFAYDLSRYIELNEKKKCVLFFDTYELLWDGCHGQTKKLSNDEWIRTMAEKLDNVLFVLSGREPIRWTLDSEIWNEKARCIPLEVLPHEFAERFLTTCGITDEAIQNSIISTSTGHPYYIDLCVDAYHKLRRAGTAVTPESFSGGFQKIQECFYRSLEGAEVEALRVLCIPRFYNYEVFKVLNTTFSTGYPITYFENFNSFSFVKSSDENTYIIHALMRDEIKRNLRKEIKQSIDQCMIEYYEQKLKAPKLSMDSIRNSFSELFYHLQQSVGQNKVLLRVDADYLGIVKRLQKAGETQYLLNLFLDQFDEDSHALWGYALFAIMVDMIHLSGRYKDAVKLITDYLDTYSLEDIASDEYRLNLYIRRVHHQMFYVPLQQLHTELDRLFSIVDINTHALQYCELMFMLGAHIYLPMGEYSKANSLLEQAIELAQQINSNDLLCRSQRKRAEILCAQERYLDAATLCTDTLRIAEDHELWRYAFYLRCVLAESLRLRGNVIDALNAFQQELPTATSLGIRGWIGHVHLSVGNCFSDLGNFIEASEHYRIANEIYSEIGQEWGRLNVQTAAQRLALLSSGTADTDTLCQLKESADKLGYLTLSSRITGLANGETNRIRFEFL